MALNFDQVGGKTEPIAFTYDQDRAILYALGIGAGVGELDFVYEKNLKVFPTFAVIPIVPAIVELMGRAAINLPTVLHGEQSIKLHRTIPASGTIRTTGTWTSVYDKGDKGAVLNMDFETAGPDGEPLFENKVVLMDRSAGNFDGDRGPKPERFDPPEEKSPDFEVRESTSADQAVLYRLNGDKNPLHIDPDFAKMGGLDRPILHGLCTFGFAGRAILNSVCDGDPARFKSFAVRFMGPVYPGETLITEGWKADGNAYIIRTRTGDGRVVLGNAVAEIA